MNEKNRIFIRDDFLETYGIRKRLYRDGRALVDRFGKRADVEPVGLPRIISLLHYLGSGKVEGCWYTSFDELASIRPNKPQHFLSLSVCGSLRERMKARGYVDPHYILKLIKEEKEEEFLDILREGMDPEDFGSTRGSFMKDLDPEMAKRYDRLGLIVFSAPILLTHKQIARLVYPKERTSIEGYVELSPSDVVFMFPDAKPREGRILETLASFHAITRMQPYARNKPKSEENEDIYNAGYFLLGKERMGQFPVMYYNGRTK